MHLAMDIETARNEKANEYFEGGLAKPDARLKDPEKIQESIKNQYGQCGLKWWLGKVVCITAKFIDSNVDFEAKGANEKDILVSFADFIGYIQTTTSEQITLIGKHSKGFDFPFLVGRYMVHDIGVPKPLMHSRELSDIEDMFAFYGERSQVTNLNTIAWGLGIEGKLELGGGKKMQEWVDAGDWEKIGNYCMQDTKLVCEIARRYRPYLYYRKTDKHSVL